MAGLYIRYKFHFPIRRVVIGLLIIGLVALGGWYGYRWYTVGEEPPLLSVAAAKPGIDETEVTAGLINGYVVPASNPRYLSIPKLGIEKARVQKVGTTANNDIDTPKNIHDAGWFERSMTPGAGYGAVLINGLSMGKSKKAIFADLKTLQNGDQITLQRGDGERFTYNVVENKSVSLEEALKGGLKAMMESIDPNTEGLSLITDDGKWIPRYQQFDRRIMLRAVLVED